MTAATPPPVRLYFVRARINLSPKLEEIFYE